MHSLQIPQTNERRAFHVKEAAKIYGWSRSTLYKLMKAGTLRTVKVGGRRLYSPRRVGSPHCWG